MTYKEFINQVLIVSIIFFLGMVFSSFVVPDDISYPDWYLMLNKIIRENWEIMALIVSEIAAIIPGKPKGIIHALIQIGNKVHAKQSTKKFNAHGKN